MSYANDCIETSIIENPPKSQLYFFGARSRINGAGADLPLTATEIPCPINDAAGPIKPLNRDVGACKCLSAPDGRVAMEPVSADPAGRCSSRSRSRPPPAYRSASTTPIRPSTCRCRRADHRLALCLFVCPVARHENGALHWVYNFMRSRTSRPMTSRRRHRPREATDPTDRSSSAPRPSDSPTDHSSSDRRPAPALTSRPSQTAEADSRRRTMVASANRRTCRSGRCDYRPSPPLLLRRRLPHPLRRLLPLRRRLRPGT